MHAPATSSSHRTVATKSTPSPLAAQSGRKEKFTLVMMITALAAAFAALAYTNVGFAATNITTPFPLPPQSVYVSPLSFAVMNSTISRNTNTTFDPTETAPPFFQIFDPAFLSILGPSPSFHRVAYNAAYAFAHEAPLWYEPTNELFFTANDGGPLGYSSWYNNSKVGKISLGDVDAALQAQGGTGDVNVNVTELPLPDSVQMTNGATGPYNGSLLLVTSGRAELPPSVVLVNPVPPYNTTVLLDNYFGRQFNSLNDIKIHDGKFFFTDVTYGWLNGFRPAPGLPNQVYRLDPVTGNIRVVADKFDKNNGIAFNKEGTLAFVTDTGYSGGFLGMNETEPATIYQYDVSPTHQFTNRRTFAYADTGIPDGIQLDEQGNVYSGCGDGVQVWGPDGTLLGKFFLNTTSSNLVFAGPGRLMILAQTAIYQANIAASGFSLSYP